MELQHLHLAAAAARPYTLLLAPVRMQAGIAWMHCGREWRSWHGWWAT